MSLGQILEKPFVRSRGHILSSILMKLGWSVCHLVCVLKWFMSGQKLGHQVKSLKNLVHTPEAYFWSDTHETWSECLP